MFPSFSKAVLFIAALSLIFSSTACKKDDLSNAVGNIGPKMYVPHWGNNTISTHVYTQSFRKHDTLSFTASGASVNAQANGANAIVIFPSQKIGFVSYDNGNGGIVQYNIDGFKTAVKPSPANKFAAIGSTLGMALDTTKNLLYAATPNRLVKFTNVSNSLDQYTFCPSINGSFLAGVAIAPNGDVWVSDYSQHCLWYYSAAEVANPANAVPKRIRIIESFTSSVFINMLRQPEGLAFDAAGNLYIGNNNDGSGGLSKLPVTTIVKVEAAHLASTMTTSSDIDMIGTKINIPNKVGNNPNGYAGQLGGLFVFDGKLYAHDQEHSCIWKYDIANLSAAPDYILSGSINAPGFGGIFISQPKLN